MLLIEDSPRNLLSWITDAQSKGLARGAVINPFASPWSSLPYRRSARDMALALSDVGAEVWFDPMTHALQMAGVGDFRYYDAYDLWGGPRADLTTPAYREEHVRKVFAVQDRLSAPHLGPTILLHHSETATSLAALQLATSAKEIDPGAWLTIAGTAPFWSSGRSLDAHIGSLAQLQPAGWFLTVARPLETLPVACVADEVFGLCRTTRALSEYAPVFISHGDLAGLAAVAAGAQSLGTGWDQRQRVCAFPSFAARGGGGGGGWYERPTLRVLLGSVMVSEGAVLLSQDAALAARLGGIPAPGPQEAFLHHLGALDTCARTLVAEQDLRRRYDLLEEMYVRATAEWPQVLSITGSRAGADEWVSESLAGLRRYGASEGW